MYWLTYPYHFLDLFGSLGRDKYPGRASTVDLKPPVAPRRGDRVGRLLPLRPHFNDMRG